MDILKLLPRQLQLHYEQLCARHGLPVETLVLDLLVRSACGLIESPDFRHSKDTVDAYVAGRINEEEAMDALGIDALPLLEFFVEIYSDSAAGGEPDARVIHQIISKAGS